MLPAFGALIIKKCKEYGGRWLSRLSRRCAELRAQSSTALDCFAQQYGQLVQ